MAQRRRPRQCPRCGRLNPAKARECASCFTKLVKTPFRMTKERLKYVHMLAREKGLIRQNGGQRDDEYYRLRLQRYGVTSSKDLKRKDYYRFVAELRALPDVVRRAA